MPVAQSPANYINSSKGCASITESFLLCFLLVHKMSLSPLARHFATPLFVCRLDVQLNTWDITLDANLMLIFSER
jgi:hypothetical protein